MGNVRDWMYLPRRLPEFDAGVIEFLNASFAKAAIGSEICCPCKRCMNRYWYRRDEVFDHLKGYGFVQNYNVWVFHGETSSQTRFSTCVDDNGDGLMANKKQLDDYEENKPLRVQDNQERLRDLGVKRSAKSLTSLVESKKMKKKIVNPTYSNAREVTYIPDMGDDSGEDYPEVATGVEVAKKQQRPRYIAPMSMTKVADLAKQRRVLAPKVSDSNIIKENHFKATLTMSELISSNKGTRQRNIFEQNLAKPTCIKRGSKKRLVLVDEDDDMFQDDNEVDIELAGLEDDGNEGYIMRSQDYVDQDDEYEDMDLIVSANSDDEIQGDDSHGNLEDEDARLVQDQLHCPELEKAIEISNTNKRGPTMLNTVHTRKVDEREVIICNEFGQPVGPVTKEKDVVGRFSRFLGTIARNRTYAPLIHTSWKKVPHKDKIWEYVLEKYDVPDAAKTWVLKSIGHSYKVHKCRFKKKHFYQHKDNKTRWKNRPKNIPDNDFLQLLRLWSNKDMAKRCLRAKEIRMSQKNMHTAGPKSFARIREEMRNDDPNKELPTLCQIFEHTHKRTKGCPYLDTDDDISRKIEQKKNYKPPEDGNAFVDHFTNKDDDDYLRLYGRGVTKKMDGDEEPYMRLVGLMESFKMSLEAEKTQLLEMRKKFEEDHQREKAEIEAMQKDFEIQRANIEATMQNIMTKLPIGVLQNLKDE